MRENQGSCNPVTTARLTLRMRADDDITEDGDVTEDSMQGLNDGNTRSFSVTADPFCELRFNKHKRLVE